MKTSEDCRISCIIEKRFYQAVGSLFLIDFKLPQIFETRNVLTKLDIKVHKEMRTLTKIQIQLTIFILSIEILVCFRQILNHILSDFVKTVRKMVKLNIYLIDNLLTDTRADVINFSRFIILIINVYDYLDLNLLTSFFSFRIFSTTDKKFRIEMHCQLFS